MARVLNAKGLRINTNKEEALVVNGSTIINKNGEVQAAVTIADKSITTGKLADKAVTTGKIADKAIELGKLAEAVQSAYVIKFVETGLTGSEGDTTLEGVEVGDIAVIVGDGGGASVEEVDTKDTIPAALASDDFVIVLRATS